MILANGTNTPTLWPTMWWALENPTHIRCNYDYFGSRVTLNTSNIKEMIQTGRVRPIVSWQCERVDYWTSDKNVFMFGALAMICFFFVYIYLLAHRLIKSASFPFRNRILLQL